MMNAMGSQRLAGLCYIYIGRDFSFLVVFLATFLWCVFRFAKEDSTIPVCLLLSLALVVFY
jgi:hypothetical protein